MYGEDAAEIAVKQREKGGERGSNAALTYHDLPDYRHRAPVVSSESSLSPGGKFSPASLGRTPSGDRSVELLRVCGSGSIVVNWIHARKEERMAETSLGAFGETDQRGRAPTAPNCASALLPTADAGHNEQPAQCDLRAHTFDPLRTVLTLHPTSIDTINRAIPCQITTPCIGNAAPSKPSSIRS